ncbi:MAG: sulfate respiration complex hexadecaheme cytochrome HmcA [Nitrospirota bacterium]
MVKKLLPLLIITFLFFLIFNGIKDIYSVEEKPKIEKRPEIKIKPENKIGIAHTEIFDVLERPQVVFDHDKHVKALKEEGCEKCHPLDKEKGLILFEFPKKVEKKDGDSVMKAYHDECIECHKKRYKEDKKAGPVTCGDCHKKEFELVRLKYPVVEFDFSVHDTHDKKLQEKGIKENCDLCHHIYNEEPVYEKGREWSCYSCHDIGKKRSPLLAAPNEVTAKKGFTVQKVSHVRCLNCHLHFMGKKEKAGPIVCSKCHAEKYKTVAELEKVPRPGSGQPEKPLIDIENAKMKGVLFDHKAHEKYSKACRECHHQTLYTCKECHGLTGTRDGEWVNVSNAYHDVLSEHSCAGCHNKKKSEKDCAGCHGLIPIMDIQAKGPKKETCVRCHTGKKEIPEPPALSVAKLDPEIVKKEVEVKILEKEFKPAKFPHRKIIEGLVKISNDSKMGRYFHAKMQTICDGCHHQSRAEAEAKKDTPPFCRNCHSISFDPLYPNRPRLQAVYHNQCIKCHENMKLEKPKKCTECHEEKPVRPLEILSKPG